VSSTPPAGVVQYGDCPGFRPPEQQQPAIAIHEDRPRRTTAHCHGSPFRHGAAVYGAQPVRRGRASATSPLWLYQAEFQSATPQPLWRGAWEAELTSCGRHAAVALPLAGAANASQEGISRARQAW
jgi:hypothetical protein